MPIRYHLAAVDPGVHATGVAYFSQEPGRDGVLELAELFDAASLPDMLDAVERIRPSDYVRAERPTVYGKGGKGDPNDLISIAIVAGAASQRARLSKSFVEPRTWKGQTPKEIHHARVRGALTLTERARLDRDLAGISKSLQHNVLDAVGLGLWHLGRLK